jgi:ATP-binding cassette subfamily C protein LapB
MLSHTRFVKPRYFRLLLASSLALNALALALPLMTMQIYDRVLSNRAVDTLIILSCGVILAATIEFILRICRSMVVGLNGASFEHEAVTSALGRLLEAEPRAHAEATTSTLAQDIGAAARLKDYYGGQMMVTLLVDMPFTLVFLGLETWLAGWLVLVPCAVLGVFLYVSWHQGMRLRTMMDKREIQDDARYGFITQSLQVVHTIKSLCLEATMTRRFEEVQRESGQTNYELACMHGQAGSLSYGFAQLMTVAVICAGAPMAIASHITVGTLIACVLLSGQIMQPLQRGLAMWVRFQDIALAKERLSHLLTLERRPFLAAEALEANHGAVRLEQMRFSYDEGKPVFDGANLVIEPGDAVAISGASGSGKTTLLELLSGIYAPDKGRVLLSGMDVSALPMSERARYVAYLPMSGMIMRGSIMDNLTGFNPQARAQARAVADQLGIEEAVALLPSGYDTPLEGHATDVVPPGLKQRISIARALLYKPRLILFDNADHGMDQESYTRIFGLLAKLKGKATLVLVSEDRNILSMADHVYDLRHRQLTQTMMPASLLAQRTSGKRGSL